ncbi:Cyclin [Lachnellula subtilissima]|uniref:RNA polymerase II holoenzyme cyclin-like subunit n=1 Tax=Lachnellula subtilissima TaxID=602034 RepID=A0A8H8RHD0_9HELO|nr:Cyclin [Lachnellula subtilissima]
MAPSSVSEDERYRTSTQYRIWSFTPTSLFELRTTTNRNAANRVRDAVRRVREARAAASSGNTSEADGGNSRAVSAAPEGEVDCLTVEEELKLVTHFCRQTLQLGDHLQVPTDVKATAVQYIKRFYITNSCMTYDPKTLLKTALFFATKTENHYFRLTKFAEAITATKPEEILASEFLLTQGLRFTFDVRHPFRALEGAVMELQAMANGQIPGVGDKLRGMSRRVKEAHGKAREYLKTSALLTDVYFHYTPCQIMMASLLIADRQLISLYLGLKLAPGSANSAISAKLMEALDKCAEMLQSMDPGNEQSVAEKKELGALAKKLRKCRNPEKIDLVSLQRAKREGDGEDDERVVKKRKLEREQSAKEGHDLFGPTIQK